MPEPSNKAHTATPWRVGHTLMTAQTERWSPEQWETNEREERRCVFANFHAEDEGRSRVLVCEAQTEEDAKFIVLAGNSYPRAALDTALTAFRKCARHTPSCPYQRAKGECDCGVAEGFAALSAVKAEE